MVSRLSVLGAGILLLCACSEGVTTNTGNTVETSFIAEAKQAAERKFDEELSFVEIYENKTAVCGVMKKGEGEPQQFIYVRNHFLIQELSPSGEWESQWFTECDDG